MTFYMCSMVVLLIVVLQVKQLKNYYSIKQEYTTLLEYKTHQESSLEQKKTLTKKHKQLIQSFNRITQKKELPHIKLSLIANLVPNAVRLVKLTITHNTITLLGEAQYNTALTAFIRALTNDKNLTQVTLVKAHHKNNTPYLCFEITAEYLSTQA